MCCPVGLRGWVLSASAAFFVCPECGVGLPTFKLVSRSSRIAVVVGAVSTSDESLPASDGACRFARLPRRATLPVTLICWVLRDCILTRLRRLAGEEKVHHAGERYGGMGLRYCGTCCSSFVMPLLCLVGGVWCAGVLRLSKCCGLRDGECFVKCALLFEWLTVESSFSVSVLWALSKWSLTGSLKGKYGWRRFQNF